MELGPLGLWSVPIKSVEVPGVLLAVAEAERSGYSTIWFPAATGPSDFKIARELLGATESATVGTAITSIWTTSPAEARKGYDELEQYAPGRFLLGLGASHGAVVDRSQPGAYERPLTRMAQYLAELTVPRDRRILAALGPKMLDLAREQSLGTHPYLLTPSLTGSTRARRGPEALVAVEVGVIAEENPERARELARHHVAVYLTLPNYVNNWLRHGYEPADVAHGGSDRLIDDLFAWGSTQAIGDRVRAHYEAGADHVAIQVVAGAEALPVALWQAIAQEMRN